jgi:AraC-like DNA-binding protein
MQMIVAKDPFARYLPINEDAVAWGMYCKDAGYNYAAPGVVYPPAPGNHPNAYSEKVISGRVLQEFQIVYIVGGSGWFRDRSGKQPIKAGDLFILFPGIEHAYSPDSSIGWQEYWVGFQGKHAKHLWESGLISHREPIHHLGLDQSVMRDFEQILQLCNQQPRGFQVLLGVRILQMLAHIYLHTNDNTLPNEHQDIVRRCREILEFNAEGIIDIQEVARELDVSYQYLLSLFKKQLGMTPYQYYIQMRIHRAQELLTHSDLSIKEIASLLNFENQFYFSRFFKKKTGLTPSQWRTEESIE